MKTFDYFTDACFICDASNLFYLSGYENADAVFLLEKNCVPSYYTDARYFEEIKGKAFDFCVNDIKDLFPYLQSKRFSSISVEKNLPLDKYLELKKLGIEEFRFIDEEISALRKIKSSSEISAMEKAQSITDRTFGKILNEIREGITERQLASALEGTLFAEGAEALAFSSIVAFGENTAKPHAHRTDKKLEKGMAVTMDFGAKIGGYCSDMTRTVFFGKPSDKIRYVYESVLSAQNLALQNIKVGMSGRECDEIARGYFREKKLDKYFIHSLGHGIGIDCHENPSFSPKCEEIITIGNVLSVEPGLYFEGEFGIRIEDVIYFDENGTKNLTKSPKNMIII